MDNNNIKNDTSGREKTAPPVPTAFGEDRNSYAYPTMRGMSGMGVASVVCGLCAFLIPLTGLVGIGLAIAGIVRNRRDVLCYIGLAVSVGMTALTFSLVNWDMMCSML